MNSMMNKVEKALHNAFGKFVYCRIESTLSAFWLWVLAWVV
jgi:hypothetical protein